MDILGVSPVSKGEQYVLYYMSVSKKCDSMPGNNTMQTFYFPTKEMAMEVYVTLQYFIYTWDRGYDGGELVTGHSRRYQPQHIREIPQKAIGTMIFTKINNDELMDAQGNTIKISTISQRSNELKKHICNVIRKNLPKGFYDEHMLAVLRVTGFPPRIKRTTFSLNPFKYDYVETDERTVRNMRLVLTT